MSKKKTRGAKDLDRTTIQAARDLQIRWSPTTKSSLSEANVKSQNFSNKTTSDIKFNKKKTAEVSAKRDEVESTKKEIIKSLIIVSLVLALEIMLYSIWIRFRS